MSKKLIMWIVGIIIVVGGVSGYTLIQHQQNNAWESKALTNEGNYKLADYKDVQEAAKKNNVLVLFTNGKSDKMAKGVIDGFAYWQKKYPKSHPIVLVAGNEKPSEFGFNRSLNDAFKSHNSNLPNDEDQTQNIAVSISKNSDLKHNFGTYNSNDNSDDGSEQNSNAQNILSYDVATKKQVLSNSSKQLLDNYFYNTDSHFYKFTFRPAEK